MQSRVNFEVSAKERAEPKVQDSGVRRAAVLVVKDLSVSNSMKWALLLLLVAGSASPAFGQIKKPGLPGISGLPSSGSETPNSIAIDSRIVTDKVTQRHFIEISAEVPDGWHLYSITQPAGGPKRTKIKLKESGFVLAGDFQPDKPPKQIDSEVFDDLVEEYHEGRVVWRAPINVTGSGDVESLSAVGEIDGQICSETACLPLSGMDTEFTARYAGTVELPPESVKKTTSTQRSDTIVWPVFLRNIGLGILGGLILNLMPCVLPVIGLKLISFIEQSQGSRWEAFRLNLIYALGILSVFLVLGTLAATLNLGWGEQFTNTGFKLTMVILVFAMALSFLGIWEIPIPGFVGRGKSQELAAKEGPAGAFFKGVFTTILATPCSGPFLGPLFGYTIKQPPVVTYVIMLSIGLGMALPYLIVGAIPALIRWLPRPGAWMDTFKQLMGFVLLGTTVFLMSSLNQDLFLPTIATLFAVWFGCWWIGRVSIMATLNRKMISWVSAAGSAAIVGFLSFQLLGPHETYVDWQTYTPTALSSASQQGKTVMVDFTANWCATCKFNLKFAIDTPEVSSLLEQNGIVPMLADWSDESEDLKKTLESLGSRSIPLLAIFPANSPDKPIILRDLVTKQRVLDALKQAGPSFDGATTPLKLSDESRFDSTENFIQSRRLPRQPVPTL